MLFRGWPEQAGAMDWRDVDQRAEWQDEYGDKVPVLVLGEETICALEPDLSRIVECFGEMVNSV